MTSPPGPIGHWPRLRSHWPLLKRILSYLYLVVVCLLLALLAWRLDWPAVFSAVRELPLSAVLFAAALAVSSHLVYSGFDLVGRHYTGHGLPAGRVMAITFVSYVGTLNLGALIGAIGLRQRLYARHGLSLTAMSQVFAVSIVTNWLGYLALLGLVLAGPTYADLRAAVINAAIPHTALTGQSANWPAPAWAATGGTLALTAVAVYTMLCLWRSGESLQWRALRVRLPGIRLALTQIVVSVASWLVNTGIIYVLLDGQVPFDWVLLASLAAAFIGLMTHIPAGIGVLEATFAILLGRLVPVETLIAVLLAYRLLFYLIPIPVAAGLWWRLERSG